MSRILNILYRIRCLLKVFMAHALCTPVIDVWYGGFWNYRSRLISTGENRTYLYDAYLERNCASIGLKSIFKTAPITPHGLHGIHISDGAVIGENVTIMQNVTICSNTLKGSKKSVPLMSEIMSL